MATIFEKALWICEASDCYELFQTPEDVKAFIADAPADNEIWAKRVAACNELLADFEPCIFDTADAVVTCYIRDNSFFHDGKWYRED